MTTRNDFIKYLLSAFIGTQLPFHKFTGNSPIGLNSPIIKPKSLATNPVLGLVAPASPIYSENEFNSMLANLKSLGFNLELGESTRKQYGYLAGSDEERATDLMNMFKDEDIDAIMCIRGGYGSNRILKLLDFDVIKSNPKIFVGFSDITSLHMAIYKYSNLITFHGPVGKSEWTKTTKSSFFNVLKDKGIPSYKPLKPEYSYTIHKGQATGTLLGGNLSVLCSLIGTPYLPDFTNSILFVEDVGEDVYRIDRLFSQLELSGVLDKISGFIFGKCTECDAGVNSLDLKEVLNHYLRKKNIPSFYGLEISHEPDNLTIPMGIKVHLDASLQKITFLESGVI